MTEKKFDFRRLKVLQAVACQGVKVGLCEYGDKYFLWVYHPAENTQLLSPKEFKKIIQRKKDNLTREVKHQT